MVRDYIRVKDWMYVNREKRTKSDFLEGLAVFIEFVREHHKIQHGMILCPCSRCGNRLHHEVEEVEVHIVKHGFVRDYTTWVYHGESVSPINVAEEEDDNVNLLPEEEMEEMVEGVGENDPEALTQVLDVVHRGHYGYERGPGYGPSRSYLSVSSTPAATTPTRHEVLRKEAEHRSQLIKEIAELKSKFSELDELKSEVKRLTQLVRSWSAHPPPAN